MMSPSRSRFACLAGVRFVGRTVNGDIGADSLVGPVSLKTVNGEASFSTTAYGEASTVKSVDTRHPGE